MLFLQRWLERGTSAAAFRPHARCCCAPGKTCSSPFAAVVVAVAADAAVPPLQHELLRLGTGRQEEDGQEQHRHAVDVDAAVLHRLLLLHHRDGACVGGGGGGCGSGRHRVLPET